MKKLFIFRLLFLILFMVFISNCKKEKDKDDSPKIEIPPKPIFKSANCSSDSSIDAFSKIMIAFNYNVNIGSWYNFKTFKAVIDTFAISSNNTPIYGSRIYKNDSLYFISQKPFTPGSLINAELKMHWEIADNLGLWSKIESYNETIVLKYKISTLPDSLIELDDIQICYPLKNQYHYLQNEYPHGIIKLKRDRRDLFLAPVFKSTDKLIALITDKSGYTYNSNATYDFDSLRILFDMPTDLKNEKIYHLQIIRKSDSEQKCYYQYYFRTSQFNYFSEKYNAYLYPTIRIVSAPLGANQEELISVYEPASNETFDLYESNLTTVNLEFQTSGNSWYLNETIMATLYYYIDSVEFKITKRSKEPYGIPPLHYFDFSGNGTNVILTEEMILSDLAPRDSSSNYFSVNYKGSSLMASDLYEVKNYLINKQEAKDLVEQRIIESSMKFFSRRTYIYNIYYRIPAINKITYINKLTGFLPSN